MRSSLGVWGQSNLIFFSASQALGSASGTHAQEDRLRSVPQCGHSPRQSSRQSTYCGTRSMSCSRSAGRRSTSPPRSGSGYTSPPSSSASASPSSGSKRSSTVSSTSVTTGTRHRRHSWSSTIRIGPRTSTPRPTERARRSTESGSRSASPVPSHIGSSGETSPWIRTSPRETAAKLKFSINENDSGRWAECQPARGLSPPASLLRIGEEEGEDEGDQADDDRPREGRREAVHVESDPHLARQPGGEQEHRGVDHQQEEAQRQHDQAAGEPAQQRAHQRVDEPQEERHRQEGSDAPLHADPREETGRHPYRGRGGGPAQQESHSASFRSVPRYATRG